MTTVSTMKNGKEIIVSIQDTDDKQMAVFTTYLKTQIPICDLMTDVDEDHPTLRQCWMRNPKEWIKCPSIVMKTMMIEI